MFSVKSWVGGAVVCSVGMPRRPRPYAVLGKKTPTREGIQKREQKIRNRKTPTRMCWVDKFIKSQKIFSKKVTKVKKNQNKTK